MGTYIEWTDETWNAWWGCSEVAPECGRHFSGQGAACYAATLAGRGMHAQYAGVAASGRWSGLIRPAAPAMFEKPLRWRVPRRIFTMSMSDIFHEAVPLEWLERVLATIDQCPHHTFQLLTKRPAVARRKLAELGRTLPDQCWLGVTCGHRRSLPLLRILHNIPARRKFVSSEPLLSPLAGELELDGIDWLIVGGQSGRGALPIDPDEVRRLRDRAVAAGVAFFFKQWGTGGLTTGDRLEHRLELAPARVKGGATLDGRLWHEFPPR